MTKARILVVDDDETFRGLMCRELGRRGYAATGADGVSTARRCLDGVEFELALVDLRLGDGHGLEVVRAVREVCPRTEVIVLTGHGSIDTAVDAMRAGASDYLRKPCPLDELEVVLCKALEHQSLVQRNSILQAGLAAPDLGSGFVGSSRAFMELSSLIDRVAQTDSPVLVLGETGVGKDMAAKLIHARSARKAQPFVVVDCALLHGDLLNNELFGHDRGAFTGATQRKHGLFEVADGGTILLDEIGDVSQETQVKLLRVLETGRFRRVGGTDEVAVDVRVIAATNRDLRAMLGRGHFRNDLFYRISTFLVEIPPIRERPEDIPALIGHFLGQLNARFGQARRLSQAALDVLTRYAWPGNVREILHTVERLLILTDAEVIEPHQLPGELLRESERPSEALLSLEEVERLHIRRVLEAVGHNRAQAAGILGISERTLYRKLRD